MPEHELSLLGCARGGAGLRLLPDDCWATRLLQDALLFRPLVVFIHLGENDLNHLSVNSLVDHLINYTSRVSSLLVIHL